MLVSREDWMLFRNLNTIGQKAGVPRERLASLSLKEAVDNACDSGAEHVILKRYGRRFVILDDGPGVLGDAHEELADQGDDARDDDDDVDDDAFEFGEEQIDGGDDDEDDEDDDGDEAE